MMLSFNAIEMMFQYSVMASEYFYFIQHKP